MIQLEKLKNITRFLSVPFDGVGDLEIEYSPTAMGSDEAAKLCERLDKTTDRSKQAEIMAQMFALVVVWWDLYEGETPLAITVENLRKLPVYVMGKVFSAISDNESGDKGIAKGANV